MLETDPLTTPPSTFNKGWRFYLGIVLFILCLIGPLLALVVALLPISDRLKAVLSAGLVFGLPEVFGVLAIALLGRQTFDYLMAPIWRWFRRLGPPRTVSRIRYTIGLIMFGAPLVEGAIFLHSRDWQQLYEGWYVVAAVDVQTLRRRGPPKSKLVCDVLQRLVLVESVMNIGRVAARWRGCAVYA